MGGKVQLESLRKNLARNEYVVLCIDIRAKKPEIRNYIIRSLVYLGVKMGHFLSDKNIWDYLTKIFDNFRHNHGAHNDHYQYGCAVVSAKNLLCQGY